MPHQHLADCQIRKARPDEYRELGQLIVDVYASVPGMATPEQQPGYYRKLLDVAGRAANPAISVFAAVSASGELLGSVDFIHDMAHYGSGGSAGTIENASGIRLLAVSPAARGMGIGKALTQHCIEQARTLGRNQVILHTTRAMQTAWAMYERMGFERFPEIDFTQGQLEVFGFSLSLMG